MRLKHKRTGELCSSSELNTHAMFEILVCGEDWMDTDSPGDYDVQLSSGEWKDLVQAFRDKDVITDNLNQNFREAANVEERQRGYYL